MSSGWGRCRSIGRTAPLKTVATHNDKVLDENMPPDAEIMYVDISSVDGVNGIAAKEAMLFGDAPSRARRRVRHGDVIVSTVRTYLRAIACIRDPEENLIVSTGFAVVRPRNELVPSFLGHVLTASYFVEQVIARSTGVSYPAINASDLVAIPVLVPPLAEQSSIAEFLDRETAKIDGLVEEQRRLIELLKEKRQAVISRAVTKGLNRHAPMKPSGIEWLGDVPEHWDVMRVKHLTRSIEQGWSPQCEGFPVETEVEWGVLKVGCVNGGTFNSHENKLLPADLEPIPALGILAGDLLVSRANTRELVGSAAVPLNDHPRLLLCDKLYRLRLKPDLGWPRADDGGITYVAFTATPKTKTMELFGTRPDPIQPAGEGNLPAPFHVYSMRQAIEEKFILDVLQNYTTYKLAFRLAHNGKDYDDKEVERSAALKGIMGWVRLHPYNISQKVQVVVEHFRQYVSPLLNGQAKAMVVVGSRQEVVRWKIAIDKYIKDRGYGIGTLVAFSGEVKDKESGPDTFTETSHSLNPNLRGRDIREAFNTDEFQILLVANKFQTGFDQPLLCGMYVDKRLAGIQAVQTLSRLNRAHPGKDTTYVLDFVNDTEDVLKAFKTYYSTAELANVSDPDLVYNLRAKLDAAGHYDDFEVDRVVAVELKPNAKHSELAAAVEPVVDRLQKRYKAAQEALKIAQQQKNKPAMEAAQSERDALLLFQSDMGAFQRLYTFLSQIFDYGNTAIEKRSIFYKQVLRLLVFGREREGIDLSKVVLTHHNLKNQGKRPMPLVAGENPKLEPITEAGGGSVQEKQKARA